jgi:hypothetical protein
MVANHPGPWSEFPPSKIIILFVAWLITALLMGVVASRFEFAGAWLGMAVGTVVTSLAVLYLMLLSIELRTRPSPLPEFHSTDAMMEYYATVAAEWVHTDRGITLDYSLESVEIVEEALGRIAKDSDGANPPQGTRGLAMGYGAYVGEVFRRRDGGSWAADHPMAGEGSFPMTTKSNVTIFPVGWCWRRLTAGEEDNVYHKALMFDQGVDSVLEAAEEQEASRAAEPEQPDDVSPTSP